MNICKSAGGGISARTKSLREKFSSKRSYSELSFKDTLMSSTTSLSAASDSSRGGRSRHHSHVPTIIEQGRQQSADYIKVNLPSHDFNSYNILPEAAFCSALDINCQDGEPRFPWQRDVAIQCNIDGVHSKPRPSRESSPKPSKSSQLGDKKSTLPGFGSLRFWKSSSPLNSGNEAEKKATTTKKRPKSVLCRTASFDSRGGYSRLVQQLSIPSSPTLAPPASSSLTVPDVMAVSTPEASWRMSTSKSDTGHFSASIYSAPPSRSGSPPYASPLPAYSTETSESSKSTEKSVKERNRPPFVRRQLKSAPNSMDESSPPDTSPKEERRGLPASTNAFTFDTMQRLFDLKVRAKHSESVKDLSMTKDLLLDIPQASGLSVHGKGVHGYMNLPSPNVQNDSQETNTVFKKLSSLGQHGEESEQEEPLEEEPPASVLHRRRALVPPKLITDGYESANEEIEPQPGRSSHSSNLLAEPQTSKSRRRSSIVVIPPMQICPGDLLVYSKVLTQRNDLLENFDGSTQCLASTEEANRKNKNTWSLLRLFDRSNRGKSDSLCGLEEVLSTLQPSVFVDEQLSKYKGMSWYEFLSLFEDRRSSSFVSGHRLSQPQSESRRSSGQSALTLPGSGTPTSVNKPNHRHILQRTQTFDSTNSNEGSEDLLTSSAHATRSNSCIAPVNISVRRLSGNIDLSEEPAEGTLPVQQSIDSTDLMCATPPVASSGASSTRSSFALTRSEQKRREALWDLLQSECNFMYDHLMILKNVFMEPLKKIQVEGYAMFAEPEVLFGNLDELCCVTYAFCKEFLNIVLQQMNAGELNATEVLVKLFQKSSKATALTQAYHRYTLNYINALNYLETLRRQVEFNEFEKWCSRDPRCKKLQLTDLLVSPVQHIMRVPLILKDIEMRTEDLSERETITQIIEAEENSLRELDDKMKWLKNFERLLEIQRNIVWPSVVDLDPKTFIPEFLKGPLSKQPCERLVVSPRRQIILEGALHILDSGKPVEMYVILFDDMLIITRRKKGLHKKQSSLTEKWASSCSKGNSSTTPHESMFKYVVYKQPLSLDRFYIHDVTQQEAIANNLKNVFVLVCLNRFQQIITCHTFQAPNETVKTMWVSKLRDAADRWKRTLQNTVFRSQQRLSSASVSTTASFRDSNTTNSGPTK